MEIKMPFLLTFLLTLLTPTLPAISTDLTIFHTSMLYNESTSSTQTIKHDDLGKYYVTMSIGGVSQNLVVDTGSLLVWVQSHPCSPCFSQDPSLPFYYNDDQKLLPWTDPSCPQEDSHYTEFDKKCAYDIVYADGTNTAGYLAQDTFGPLASASLAFGSSDFNMPEFAFSRNSKIAGILGMGRGRHSFVGQTTTSFSFCLVADLDLQHRSFLRIGAEDNIPPGSYELVMLDGRVEHNFYDVQLEAIFVGEDKVDVERETFNGGCILDTGAVLTRLVPHAFYGEQGGYIHWWTF